MRLFLILIVIAIIYFSDCAGGSKPTSDPHSQFYIQGTELDCRASQTGGAGSKP